MPKSWCGYTFTKDDANLLNNDEEITITAKTANGNEFTCQIKWKNVDGEFNLVPKFDT